MATETIRIIVQTSGTQQASKQLLTVAGAADRANKSVVSMNNALRAIAAVTLGRSLAALSDTYTNLENRTKVFASSTLEARDAFKGVFEVALRARAPLDATGELFGRLQLALSSTGKSSEELLRITETVTKAIAISGATAQEADGALRQLAQGMAANRLSGQELNSVLEQTPVIAKLIARELGISADKLRQVANKEGAITRDVIIRALTNSATYIDELFAKTATTFGQAFEQMRTSVTELFGNVLRSTGIANSFAQAISKAAFAIHEFASNKESVENLGIALKAIGGILIALAIAQTVAWATTPVGLFAIAIGGAIAAYLKYRDTVVEIGGVNQSVALHVEEVWGGVVEVFKGLYGYIRDIWDLLKAINDLVPIGDIIAAGLANSGIGMAISALRSKGQEAQQAAAAGVISPAQDLLAKPGIPAAKEFNLATGFEAGSLQDRAASMGLRTDVSARQLEIDINKEYAKVLDQVSMEIEEGVRAEEALARAEAIASQARTEASLKLRAAYEKIENALDPILAAQRQYVESTGVLTKMFEQTDMSTDAYMQTLRGLRKEYAAQVYSAKEFTGVLGEIVDAADAVVRDGLEPQEAALEDLLDNLEKLEAGKYFNPADADKYTAAQDRLTKAYDEQFGAIAKRNAELDKAIDLLDRQAQAASILAEVEGARNPQVARFNEGRSDLDRLNEAARNSGGDASILEEIAAEREVILKKMEEDMQGITNPDLTGMEAFKNGAIGSLHELGAVFADEATIWKEGFDSVFSTIGDSIRGFVETGKLDFRELGLAFAQEVTMMMVKILALKALEATSSALGGTGGIGGAIGSIAGAIAGGARASGGPVNPMQSVIVGEHGPERFTPTTAGVITPGAGGNVTIQMNVTTKDADSFRASKTQIESQMAGALARARQRNG